MLTAERLAADARDASRRESERRIQEAQKRAERILEDSRERLRNLNREIAELVQRKDLYVQKFRSLVQAQQIYLEEHEQDLAEIDEVGQDVVDLLVQDAGNLDEKTELEDEPAEALDASGQDDEEPVRDPFADMSPVGSDEGYGGGLDPAPGNGSGVTDDGRGRTIEAYEPAAAEPVGSQGDADASPEEPVREEPARAQMRKTDHEDPQPVESPRAEKQKEESREEAREPVETAKGFFPPRVRRQGFFDLKADGDGGSR
jgi:hypothetical protein